MTEAIGALYREGMMLLLVVGGPLMAVLLVVGLVLGILQSATQIQEPAVGVVPRIAIVLVVGLFLGPWMVERLSRFLSVALGHLADRGF